MILKKHKAQLWKQGRLKVYKCRGRSVVKYRSAWERDFIKILEAHKNVAYWIYEYVMYYINPITKKKRKYLLDFLIKTKKGNIIAVEVKSKSLLEFNKRYSSPKWAKWHVETVIRNHEKIKLLKERSKKMGWKYFILTSKNEIFQFKRILDMEGQYGKN